MKKKRDKGEEEAIKKGINEANREILRREARRKRMEESREAELPRIDAEREKRMKPLRKRMKELGYRVSEEAGEGEGDE
jgi:hypothetical protein